MSLVFLLLTFGIDTIIDLKEVEKYCREHKAELQ